MSNASVKKYEAHNVANIPNTHSREAGKYLDCLTIASSTHSHCYYYTLTHSQLMCRVPAASLKRQLEALPPRHRLSQRLLRRVVELVVLKLKLPQRAAGGQAARERLHPLGRDAVRPVSNFLKAARSCSLVGACAPLDPPAFVPPRIR